jgi:DNA repair exonuclease SbcCD ATPase subunit
MSKQEKITAAVAVIFVTSIMALLGITNYDSIHFYQSDLDNERAKLAHMEKQFETELDISFERANEMTKKTAQYAEMEKLYAQHAINPEKNAYLEPKIDSLSNVIDSLKNEFFISHCSENLDKLHQDYKNGIRKVVMLQHDSVVNDSIKNQPIIPRFKKNWNEMFSRQR